MTREARSHGIRYSEHSSRKPRAKSFSSRRLTMIIQNICSIWPYNHNIRGSAPQSSLLSAARIAHKYCLDFHPTILHLQAGHACLLLTSLPIHLFTRLEPTRTQLLSARRPPPCIARSSRTQAGIFIECTSCRRRSRARGSFAAASLPPTSAMAPEFLKMALFEIRGKKR